MNPRVEPGRSEFAARFGSHVYPAAKSFVSGSLGSPKPHEYKKSIKEVWNNRNLEKQSAKEGVGKKNSKEILHDSSSSRNHTQPPTLARKSAS